MNIRHAIESAYELLPARISSDKATLMLLAIQRQEDPELRRYQLVKRTPKTLPENIVSEQWAKGPARGWPQMEQGGGVKGVLTHAGVQDYAFNVCDHFKLTASAFSVWRALETNDVLSAAFARLLLWADSKPLPEIGDTEGAWKTYIRVWRPGAYTNGNEMKRAELRAKWQRNYTDAMNELGMGGNAK